MILTPKGRRYCSNALWAFLEERFNLTLRATHQGSRKDAQRASLLIGWR